MPKAETKGNRNYKPLIWLKFTTDGYLGVVAAGFDFNFNMNYTSGKILKAVGKEWDKSKLVVIPLSEKMLNKAKNKYTKTNKKNENRIIRNVIERELGEYLIKEKKVIILDYYSHLY